MDAIDRKIVEALQKNARVSMRELGNTVHLSNTAAAERVKKLEEAGIIRGYQAMIDEKKCGRPIHAFIVVEFTYEVRGRPERFLAYVLKHPCIYSANPILTGGLDYIIEVHCADMAELHRIQTELYAFGLTTTYMAEEDKKKHPWEL